MRQSINYEMLSNGNIVLKNVPDPELGNVDVEMRDLNYDDILLLQQAQKPNANVVEETYKIFASIIVRWGEQKSLTTLELRTKGFRIYRLLEKALQEFFLIDFTFELDEIRVSKNSVSAK